MSLQMTKLCAAYLAVVDAIRFSLSTDFSARVNHYLEIVWLVQSALNPTLTPRTRTISDLLRKFRDDGCNLAKNIHTRPKTVHC